MKEDNNKDNTAVAKSEQQAVSQPVQQLSPGKVQEAFQGLYEFGGFSFLESFIEGIANMNPDRSTRKKLFLTESDKKYDRIALLKNIKLWIEILSSSKDINEMLEKCRAKSEVTNELLTANQLAAVETVKDLERSYRTVMLFYKNTEQDKVRNVTIMNASKEQITDLDNSRFIDFLAEEMKQYYDKLDLRMNYSLLVLPGYLGSKKVIHKWAKIAYSNKVMLITDFADLEKPDDVVDMFFTSNLTGGDTYLSNAMMCCNWLIGRGKYDELGETDHLHVPPSSSLAGKMYSTLMSQAAAGKKWGCLNEVDGVVYQLKKSELSHLENMGLVPCVNEYGGVLACSSKTLFNGDDLGKQTYSVVRVFNYIFKVLCDFLNRRAFENWNMATERDLRGQIVQFLDEIKGPTRLIERFQIIRFEQDKKQRDRIYLDIRITPYFPAKSFIIKLDGSKGNDDVNWDNDFQQEK